MPLQSLKLQYGALAPHDRGVIEQLYERDARCEWGRPHQAATCLKLLGNGDELPCNPAFLASLFERHGTRVVVERDNESNLHGLQPDLSLHLQTGRVPAKHEKKGRRMSVMCGGPCRVNTIENVTQASPKPYFSAFLR